MFRVWVCLLHVSTFREGSCKKTNKGHRYIENVKYIKIMWPRRENVSRGGESGLTRELGRRG